MDTWDAMCNANKCLPPCGGVDLNLTYKGKLNSERAFAPKRGVD